MNGKTHCSPPRKCLSVKRKQAAHSTGGFPECTTRSTLIRRAAARCRSRPRHAGRATPIAAARDWLLARQAPAGFWCGELEGDTTLESYLILLEAFFGPRRQRQSQRDLARMIRDRGAARRRLEPVPGRPAGAVGLVPQLLRAEGRGRRRPTRRTCARARDAILALGGVGRANTYTRYHLALFGQYPWDERPGDPARDDLPARPRRRSASTTCRAGRARSSSRCRSSGRRSRCASLPAALRRRASCFDDARPAASGARRRARPGARSSHGVDRRAQGGRAPARRRRAARSARSSARPPG